MNSPAIISGPALTVILLWRLGESSSRQMGHEGRHFFTLDVITENAFCRPAYRNAVFRSISLVNSILLWLVVDHYSIHLDQGLVIK